MEERDEFGNWQIPSWQSAIFDGSFLFLLWLPILAVLATLIAFILRRKPLANQFICLGTPLLVASMLLHTLLWPRRIERRFAADWGTPFPTRATVIHVRLRSTSRWNHNDLFHLKTTPSEIATLLAAKQLSSVIPTEDLLERMEGRGVSQSTLPDWRWFYYENLPDPNDPPSGYSYLMLTNPSATEAICITEFHD